MKRMKTIKRDLEKLGYTVIERDDTLVLASELQDETLTFTDPEDGYSFDYAPNILLCESGCEYDTAVNEQIMEVTTNDWFWECEYPTCFKLYKA